MRHKTCRACRQPVPDKPVVENQSRNGVRVRVFRFKSGGTVVDAACQCFGYEFRLHSTERCPLRLRLLRSEGRA